METKKTLKKTGSTANLDGDETKGLKQQSIHAVSYKKNHILLNL